MTTTGKKPRTTFVAGCTYRFNPEKGRIEYEMIPGRWEVTNKHLAYAGADMLEAFAALRRNPYVKTEVRPRVVKVSEDSTCWFKIVNRELWFTGAGEKGWVRADFAGDYSDGWREAIAECILNPTEEVEVDG